MADKAIELSILAMVIIVPLIFFTRANDVFETNKMFVMRFFTVFAAGLFLISTIKEKRLLLVKTDFDFPLAGYLAVSFLTVIFTKNLMISIFGVYEDYEGIITAINYFFLFYIVVNISQKRIFIGKIVFSILAATAIICSYGLAQNLGWDFVKWNPETYSPERFFSTLGNPNFLAAYLVSAIPVIFMLFFITKKNANKAPVLVILLAAIMVLFLTKSRAGFISLLVTLILITVYAFIDARREKEGLFKANRNWFVAFGFLLVITLFLPIVRSAMAMLWERMLLIIVPGNFVLTPRLYIWKSALMMFRDNPVFGTGLDTFQVVFPYYRLPIYWQLEWNGTPEKTHNVFLQVLATQGMAGFGFFMLLFLTYLKKSYNLIFGEKDLFRRYLVFGFFMAVAAYFTQGLFNYTVVAYGSLYWVCMAMIIALESGKKNYYSFSLEGFFQRHKKAVIAAAVIAVIALQARLITYWAADLYFKIGNIAVAADRDDLSTHYYDRAVKLNPQREIYWVKYGIGYERLVRKESDPQKKRYFINEALKIHRRTLEINPINGYNYNNIARVYKVYGESLDSSKYEDAIRYYNEAIKRDPVNAYFGMDLAGIHINRGEFDKALELCERYMRLYPDLAMPLSYMGYIYMLQGKDKTEQALYYYEQAIDNKQWHRDIVTETSTYSNLGILYANLGRVNDAIRMFEKSVERRPDYAEGYLNIGRLHEMTGNNDAAARMYETVLRINPADQRALGQLEQLRKR